MKGMPMRWTYLLTGLFFLFSLEVARGQEGLIESAPETAAPLEAIAPDNDMTAVSAGIKSTDAANADLFGDRVGYIHPSLAVNGYYTSNLFRAASREQSDRYAIIVPGIWLALPARNQRLPEIGTSTTAPGGSSFSRFTLERERRVQGYAQYQARILKYDRFQDEDRIDHRGQGILKFSSRRSVSLELADSYERNSDPYGTGGRIERYLDTYDANLFTVIFLGRLTEKILLRADYGQYRLNYAADRNSFRDRNDDSYSGYLFFRTTPKTTLFAQTERVMVNYDENLNIDTRYDTRHSNYYLGVKMQTSATARGSFKAGYGRQKYGAMTTGKLLAEALLDYDLTPKTSISLQGTRRVLEADQVGARSILSHRIQAGYRQRLAAKWQSDALLFFNRNEYDGTVLIGNRIATNYYHDEFGGALTLGYSPATGRGLNLGYEYRQRDANFDSEDYRSHIFSLRATAAF